MADNENGSKVDLSARIMELLETFDDEMLIRVERLIEDITSRNNSS